MKKNKSIFPKNFDALQSDFARASLALPMPDDLSKQINRNRWKLYVSSLGLRQLIDEFANGLDELNDLLKNAPYVFDFEGKSEGLKARTYSKVMASTVMAQDICQRLRVEGAYGEMRPTYRIHLAAAALVEFDNDEPAQRQKWVELNCKAGLLNQNKGFAGLEMRLKDNDKLFRKMAYFIN